MHSFLRFLVTIGRCEPGLEKAIPTVVDPKFSTVPRHVSQATVERIIAAARMSRQTARRDRAVLLLLARLGLRPGDVRQMRIDDIDWTSGRIRVIGKTRTTCWLPMTREIGQAIADYLKHERPCVSTAHLFVRARAPLTPLSRTGLTCIVTRAIRRAKVKAPMQTAYLLRHSAAVAMLKEGRSLDQIRSILRHKSLSATTVYAKADEDLLREVAQPWPA